MNKYEPILYLKSPKLLSYAADNIGHNKPAVDLKDVIGQSSYINKGDKKNKSSYKQADFLENKKNKNKQKKKVRGRLYIDEDLSIIGDELGTNSISEVDFMRNSKGIKTKKDNRYNVPAAGCNTGKENSVNDIYLNNLLTVQDLADKMGIASTDIIKWLFLKGISVTINQLLDMSISTLVAEHYSFNILKKLPDSDHVAGNIMSHQHGRMRAPVIALFGHVDHGKTTLLRAIRQDDILIREAGHITQSIGSYEIFIDDDPVIKKLIFLDTPGHEAFIGMRKRGASITDLAILVVSADDGLMPQTVEAIEHIQKKHLPFIVAINKIDKPEANVAKVKDQLLTFGITDQIAGGAHCIIGVSALNGENISALLSSVIALSKAQGLKSDPSARAQGTILDAYLNRQKGPVAQLLVQNGTLYVGDFVIAGSFYGKVKAICDSMKQKIKSIESVALADILCFTEVPVAGLSFRVVDSEKAAKAVASNYAEVNQLTLLNNRISLDDAGKKRVRKIIKQVNLIIKTSTQGAIDAIMHTLAHLPQEKIQINLLLAASGEISVKDIELALTSHSIVLAFNLSISSAILHYAEKKEVAVQSFTVIYDLIHYVKSHMLTFVDVDYENQILGYAEIKSLFTVNKSIAAGCFIKSGKLKKKSYFQVKRDGQNIYTGTIDSLRKVKQDVDEVSENSECGVMCQDYNLWEIGDLLECYILKSLDKTL